MAEINKKTESSDASTAPDVGEPITDTVSDSTILDNQTLPSSDQPQNYSQSYPNDTGCTNPLKTSLQSNSHPTTEQQLIKAKRDLENMVIKYARSESENLMNKNKVDELDKKLKRAIKDNESLANRIRILTNDKNSITDTLNAKLAQLTVLEQRNNSLSNVQTIKLKELQDRCEELEESNEELLRQIETYKNKEGELLDFSERLSMKQLFLQTELDKALSNTPDYKAQYEQSKKLSSQISVQNTELVSQVEKLSSQLTKLQETNKQLSETMTESDLNHRRRIDELENEMKVMRRKHQIAAKEIHRQMKVMSETTANTQQRKIKS